MSDPNERNPVEEMAEEFLERLRRGERPALTDYTQRHPDLAEQIRDLFPALVMMEEMKPGGLESAPDRNGTGSPLPKTLGDFRILREVGRGGMGIVYEAEQMALGRHVALKVIPREASADPSRLLRFEREAKAAARLHHTNIVPVYDVGVADGVHYYAMQFIQGQAVDEVLVELRRLRGPKVHGAARIQAVDRNRATQSTQTIALSLVEAPAVAETAQPPSGGNGTRETGGTSSILQSRSDLATQREFGYYRSVARLTLQVADALAYAHAQRVTHRDIKPANLLLDALGTVWVTDFGLAKEEGIDLTQTGDIVGTLRYMAPERFSGVSDARSDVYSLGLTLYELITLRPAFDESDRVRLIRQITHDEPRSPRRHDRRVPRDLETIVLKASAKEPGARYQTAEAMAADLRRFLADRPIEARRASITEQLWRWRRRNPVMAGLTAAVAVLLLVVAVGSSITALWLNSALTRAQSNLDRALQAEIDADTNRWRSHLLDARASRLSRSPGQRFLALKNLRQAVEIARARGMPAERFDEMRNEAIASLALPDLYVAEEWPGHPSGTQQACIDEKFELIARANEDGSVSVRQLGDDQHVHTLPPFAGPTQISFGPHRMFVRRGDTLAELWDLSTPAPALRLKVQRPIIACHFQADGKHLTTLGPDGRVLVYDAATGGIAHEVSTGFAVAGGDIRFNPIAPLVVVSSYFKSWIELWDIRTGKLVARHDPPWPGGNARPAWSPDGNWLAVPEGDGGRILVYRFELEKNSLRPVRLIDSPAGATGGFTLAFNAAGDRVIAHDWSNRIFLFDIFTGRMVFATHPMLRPSEAPLQFDPLGQRLGIVRTGAQQERFGLMSVADGREYRKLVSRSRRTLTDSAAVVFPDSRLMAQSVADGLAFFDLERGNELEFMPVSIDRNINGGVGIACNGQDSFYTNSFNGLFRWPIRNDQGDLWSIGPPEKLAFHPGNNPIAVSRDGQVVAQAMWNGYGMAEFAGGWVMNSGNLRKFGPHRSEAHPCVSPDGRWTAFSNRVYDSATGECVWESESTYNKSKFTADGRWMVTSHDGGRVFEVGTWRPAAQLVQASCLTVSPDSSTAIMGKDGIYRLVEIATGRELARFEDPDLTDGPVTFSPDGTALIVTGRDGVRVWNLRLIRQRLKELGLDWDAPAFPERPIATAGPLTVRIDEGELAAARNFNNRAWVLLVGPQASRDPQKALELVRKALALEPRNNVFLNTLGVAQCRNGLYKDAVATLEQSLAAGRGEFDAFDLYFLSMCHSRLKDEVKARECFQRATAWVAAQSDLSANHLAELKQFRAEAEAELAKK